MQKPSLVIYGVAPNEMNLQKIKTALNINSNVEISFSARRDMSKVSSFNGIEFEIEGNPYFVSYQDLEKI